MYKSNQVSEYQYRFEHNGVPLPHHIAFFQNAIGSLLGELPYRKMFFGGGIRGGKTYLCLYILILAAKKFNGIRIHIIRKSLPSLMSTIVPSMRKLLDGVDCEEKKGSGNYHFRFPNGSEIYLFSENFDADKDLNRFKGLETNIIFLEQIEELNEKTYQKAIERFGTYLVPGKPNPLILSTMNPTMVPWVRNLVYIPWRDNNVPDDTYIGMVTAKDLTLLPGYLHENWKSMDPLSYKQYVEGDWDVLNSTTGFFYAFNRSKHVVQGLTLDNTVYLSFDFNVNPMTCLVACINKGALKIVKEIRQENSSIPEIVKELVPIVRNKIIFITGDSTGNSRNVLFQNKNLYSIILSEFAKYKVNINSNAVKVPRRNLLHVNSRQLCNKALNNLDVKIDASCEYLIADLNLVTVDTKGSIDKTNKNITHLSDCFRYLIHTFFFDEL